MSNARDFAIVSNGRVLNIARGGDASGFGLNTHTIAIDVTDRSDRPCIGWSYDASNNAFSAPPPFARDEATTKADAIALVNGLAGECRARYLTVVPGQAETYLLKADELRAYDAAYPVITPSDYPILSAEATATGMTLDAVASLVRTTRAAWLQLAAHVEGMRRGAITRIELATSEADVLAAIPENWP